MRAASYTYVAVQPQLPQNGTCEIREVNQSDVFRERALQPTVRAALIVSAARATIICSDWTTSDNVPLVCRVHVRMRTAAL